MFDRLALLLPYCAQVIVAVILVVPGQNASLQTADFLVIVQRQLVRFKLRGSTIRFSGSADWCQYHNGRY